MKQFYGERNEVLLNTSFDMDRVVLFVPGMSGKAHSSRFAWLDEVADEAGYASARVNLWDDADELQTLTWNDVQVRMAAVVELLKKHDFIEIVLVAKSFGGAVALLYNHPLVSKKILWSPAITYSETSNLASLGDTTLGSIQKLTDITITKTDIKDNTVPVCIIHGDADEVIGVGNSKAIVAAVSTGQLQVIEGADHSFGDESTAAQLQATTSNYLTAK